MRIDTHDGLTADRSTMIDLPRYRPAGIILASSGSPQDVLAIAGTRNVPVLCMDSVIGGVDSIWSRGAGTDHHR